MDANYMLLQVKERGGVGRSCLLQFQFMGIGR